LSLNTAFPSINKERIKMRKKIAIILLTLAAIGSLSLAMSYAQAFPLMGPNRRFNNFAVPHAANKPVQQSWVQINGITTKWGSTNVTGSLSAHIRTTLFNNSETGQLAPASSIWTTDKFRPLTNAVRTKENFTRTFYSARLMNASVAMLNYDDSNFFMNGTWNVNTVTVSVTVTTDSDGNITGIHRNTDITPTKAYGELTVTGNWTKFTLAIKGIDPLTGSVRRSMMRQIQWNPFKITDDLTGSVSDSVTKADLAAVAKCYGNMPGWGSYDQNMDFNFNYRIDIADLATVAANVQ
jgi:hypothetical protein